MTDEEAAGFYSDPANRQPAGPPVTRERPRGLIPGSGRPGGSKALDSVVSVRFRGDVLARIRAAAEAHGDRLSDWIRNAACRELARVNEPPAGAPRIKGWSCPHVAITSLPGVLGPVRSACGCDMQPVYANAA